MGPNQSLQQTKPPVTSPACAGAAPADFAAEAGVRRSELRRLESQTLDGDVMAMICRTILLVIALSGMSNAAIGEVFTQTFSAPPWYSCYVNSAQCMAIDVDLGFGVAHPDSVWIELSGVSHQGVIIIVTGDNPVHYRPCQDDLLVSFRGEPEPECTCMCSPHPDGVIDCYGARLDPTGDLQPFVIAKKMSGLELVASGCRYAHEELDSDPDFGNIFLDGHAVLLIRSLNDKDCDWGKCFNGYADIAQVTVHIAYSAAMATQSETWGGLKAIYR